ncbi:MAG: serine/threonine protein kinase/formylglycine-generating enzyme required for sulfatase activity [Candidatus Paceibacteria bacterium]
MASSKDSQSSAEDDPLQQAVGDFIDWAQERGLAPEELELGGPMVEGELDPTTNIPATYELCRVLGEGGMGIVYEASQKSIPGRRVALKILKLKSLGGGQQRERFRREIIAVGRLDHPCIVPIFDAGAACAQPFLAMKFIPGKSVKALLNELRRKPSPPGTTEVVRTFVGASGSTDTSSGHWDPSYARWIARVGLQLAEALQHAHEREVVHRDVKPGNVIITPDGGPVLLDFGLASHQELRTITLSGDFLGTLAYASPEQLAGEPIDPQTDIYSLGVMLFELLELRRPYEAERGSGVAPISANQEPWPLSRRLPRDLRTIIYHCIARRATKRYPSAEALAHDLRCFLQGSPIKARVPGVIERTVQLAMRHPIMSVALLVALLALGTATGVAHSRANVRVEQGRGLLKTVEEECALLEHQLEAYGAMRGERIPARLEMEQMRGELEATEGRIEAGLQRARSTLEQAFEHVAGHGASRRALADLYAKRLDYQLALYSDLLDPAAVQATDEGLRRFDDALRYADLLKTSSWVNVDASGIVAKLRVFQDETGELVFAGVTPQRITLEAGSYVAELIAAGRVRTRLPFVVRRSACYLNAGAVPSRELRVSMLRKGQVPPGYIVIPGGDTLVDSDPVHWITVSDFMIKELEVSLEDWVHDTNLLERQSGIAVGDPSELQVERSGDGSWVLQEHASGDLPVRGGTPMEYSDWALRMTGIITPCPPDWYPDLPTVAEWMRASRGADARSFPWGDHFDSSLCANYESGPSSSGDALPIPVGRFPGDVSPFGVRDMAGSVVEQTRDLFAPRAGEYKALGGSYMTTEQSELKLEFGRNNRNDRPLPDVGYRPVLRPLPSWAHPLENAPRTFRDDFNRPDGESLGGHWIELLTPPFSMPTNPNFAEECFIENERLVCCGGKGQFSNSSGAWYPIGVGTRSVTMRASIAASHSIASGERVPRSLSISFVSGLAFGKKQRSSLMIGFDGTLVLGSRLSERQTGSIRSTELEFNGPWIVELVLLETWLEARVWEPGSTRPGTAQVRLARPAGLTWPRFMAVEAPNLVGARLELDWIEVEVQ